MTREERVAFGRLGVWDHEHSQRGGSCRCSATALEPDPDCPVHGGGPPWPPRCVACGQFLPWPPPVPLPPLPPYSAAGPDVDVPF